MQYTEDCDKIKYFFSKFVKMYFDLKNINKYGNVTRISVFDHVEFRSFFLDFYYLITWTELNRIVKKVRVATALNIIHLRDWFPW